MRHVVCKPRFPNVSKMEFLPERLEARPDDRPDLRTDDEKVRDARNSRRERQEHMKELRTWERMAINRAVRRMDDLHIGGDLTKRGIMFLAAIRSLAEVAK